MNGDQFFVNIDVSELASEFLPADGAIHITVTPGAILDLPVDPIDLKAGFDESGNLVLISGLNVIVLHGYDAANQEAPVTLLDINSDPIDVADAVLTTNPSDFDWPSDLVDALPSNGIYTPFADGQQQADASGAGIEAAGVLDGTLGLAGAETDLDGGAPFDGPRINYTPTVGNITLAASEDGLPVIGTFDGADKNGDPLTFEILIQPSEGTVVDNGDGTFYFVPGAAFQDLAEGETREVSFTYVAKDPEGATSAPATVTVTVTGVNDSPDAKNVAASSDEDGAVVTAAFSADDVDSDDDAASLVYSILTQPAEGSVVNNGNGTFGFDPGHDFQDLAEGETRDVSFTYQVTDKHGATDTATATITITGHNDAPVTANVKGAVTESGYSTIAFAGEDIDSDDNQASLTYVVLFQPLGGHVTVNGDGTFTFEAGDDFEFLPQGSSVPVNFLYAAVDAHGAYSNISLATITVTGENDAPVARNVTASTTENLSATRFFDTSDADLDGLFRTYQITSQPSAGAVSLGLIPGTFRFNPGTAFDGLAAGETKDVSFTYTATDSHGAVSNEATVTIHVTGQNDAPVANNQSVAITENQSATVTFAADDIDSDDDTASLAYTVLKAPTKGSVSINGDGTFTYNPGTDFDGLASGQTEQVSFTYRATDDHGANSATRTVTVTVTGTNDAPVAGNVSQTVSDIGSVTMAFPADDIDSDDNQASLTYVILGQPLLGGHVTVNGDGTFTFDTDGDFAWLAQGASLPVSFAYVAIDSHGAASNIAIATFTVSGTNQAPVANNLTINVTESGTATGFFSGSDADIDGIFRTYQIVAQPIAGIAAAGFLPGSFTFKTSGQFEGLSLGESQDVSFTYTAKDSHGAVSAPATVTVHVTGQNDAPTAANQAITVAEGASATIAFAADDIDSDDNTASLSYSILKAPTKGSVAVNGDGTYTFDAGTDFDYLNAGESAQVTFTYRATDSHGANSSTRTVTVTVTGEDDNLPPVAVPMTVFVDEDTPLIGAAFAGFDPNGDAITYQVLSGPVVNNGDGTFSYDPTAYDSLAQGESSVVSFSYEAIDSMGAHSAPADSAITITGLNDAPVAFDQAFGTDEDTGFYTSFAGADVDNGAVLTYQFVGPADGFTNNGDGTFTFDPGADFQFLKDGESQNVSVQYQAIDEHGAISNTGTIVVTVTGKDDIVINHAPDADDQGVILPEGKLLTLAFAGDDVDADDDQASLTYAILTQPALGAVVSNGDGTFTFSQGSAFDALKPGETQAVSFTYQATDSHGAVSSVATVSIFVNGANVAPTTAYCPLPDAATLAGYDFVAGTDAKDKYDGDNKDNHWIQGYAGDDNLQGGSLDDLIEGGDGKDDLKGNNGNDIIIGGAGDDKIDGQAHNDCLQGNDGNDTIQGGTGTDVLHGDAGDDDLDGGSENDYVAGGIGNDTLHGGNGDDQLFGEEGDDVIFGDEANDVIHAGAGNDKLNGGANDDILYGEDGDDIITSAGGNDQVYGGKGDDQIDAGAGSNNAIYYTSALDGHDLITSFDGNPTGGNDVLNLDGLFDSLEAALGALNTAARTAMTSVNSTAPGQVDVFVDHDQNAGTTALHVATIMTVDAVTVGQDIVVV